MAKLLSNRLIQELDPNGAPYAGALLFTYEAGTSTKEATFQDEGGSTAHSNPIVLDASGRIPAGVWLTEGQAYKLVLAPSDDTDPPASPIWTLDDVTGINDFSVGGIDQWQASGLTPTYISASQFSVPGDVTSTFHVGRRLKITDAGGTKYATITATAFTTVTTVTVSVDASGSLSNPTSAVSYGVDTADNPSQPLLTDAFPIVSGSADKTKKFRLEVDGLTTATTRIGTVPDYDFRIMSQTKGADVNSATTINLDTATGDLVDVTGSTQIDAITLAEGKQATVRFTGALQLTNGASLLLPGAANITTAAGDVAIFRGYAAGVVRCVNYQRIASSPGHGMETIVAPTAFGAVASVDITSIPQHYSALVLRIDVASSDTATRFVLVQADTDNGGSFDSTASNYQGSYFAAGTGELSNDVASLVRGLAQTAAETCDLTVVIQGYQSDDDTLLAVMAGNTGSAAVMAGSRIKWNKTAPMNALRILWNGSGNFDAGNYALYGIK